jgi:hypothetical protein
MDHDVEMAVVGDDFGDARFRRSVGRDVEFDGSEIDVVLGGVARDFGDLRRVTAGGFTHAGVDRVAGMGERACGECAETA